MPIKRRDRDNEGSKNFRMEHIPTDHELFLQAFEKPTQIYRYLRTRNTISPIFLHRNLSYMKDRMSRGHKKRASFKVNSLLSWFDKTQVEAEKYKMPGNYMTLMFLGFYNKALLKDQFVEVKLVISEISHLKRKDSFKAKQYHLGSTLVKSNPVDMIGKIPAISVPSDYFSSDGSVSRSCILQIIITSFPDATNGEDVVMREPQMVTIFESELVVFDKHNRCVLTDGEYEISVHERQSTVAKSFSPKKHLTWEVIPDGCIEEFDKGDGPVDHFHLKPTLKFRLSWTKDKCTEFVDRPLPITIRKDDHFIANKENEPDQNHNKSNGEGVGSALVATATRPNTMLNNNNNINNNNTTAIIKLHDIASRIIYHFIYNNNSSQQTEAVDNFNCPWCCLHCMTLYSLLKHLKLCHARFNFTYVPTQNGVRVDVSINDLFDGSYTGSPHDLVGPAGSAFARAGPVRRTIVTRILVCYPRRPKPSLNEFLEIDENEVNSQRPYITGHNRLYHHTMTCLPVHPKNLDNDSEDEVDPAWLRHKTMQMIDEFTDVNEGEKELMKMWNLHIMRKGYVGDIQIPLACEMFLTERGDELFQKNLYKNFVLHLCNLFDYGLLAPEMVYKILQKAQHILARSEGAQRIISSASEKQVEYWLAVGIHKQKEILPQQPPPSNTKRKIAQATTSAVVKDGTIKDMNVATTSPAGNDRLAESTATKDEKIKREAKTRLDFNDQKLMVAVGPVLKKIKADINSNDSSHKRRQSTILPAKEEKIKEKAGVSGANKRKSSHLRIESPPRRRSLSAALQPSSSTGSLQSVTRRNSLAATSNLAIRKGKRMSLSLTKIGKVDK